MQGGLAIGLTVKLDIVRGIVLSVRFEPGSQFTINYFAAGDAVLDVEMLAMAFKRTLFAGQSFTVLNDPEHGLVAQRMGAGLGGRPQCPQPVEGFLPYRIRQQMHIRVRMLQVAVNHAVHPNTISPVCQGNYTFMPISRTDPFTFN